MPAISRIPQDDLVTDKTGETGLSANAIPHDHPQINASVI